MSDKPDTGGQAFPHPDLTFTDPYDPGIRERVVRAHLGMTLRDYFAAKAMAVLMREETKSGGFYPLEETADMAYAYADAMLIERAK